MKVYNVISMWDNGRKFSKDFSVTSCSSFAKAKQVLDEKKHKVIALFKDAYDTHIVYYGIDEEDREPVDCDCYAVTNGKSFKDFWQGYIEEKELI